MNNYPEQYDHLQRLVGKLMVDDALEALNQFETKSKAP